MTHGKLFRTALILALAAIVVAGLLDRRRRPEEGRHDPGRQPRRAAHARRPLDDRQHHGDPHEPPVRGSATRWTTTTSRSRCWPRACPDVSTDGLTYTFKLRRGIKFHNGKEMTSDDVVASLTRWSKQSIYGKDLFGYVAELRAVDKYTVEMKLKEKVAIVLINLAVANNFAAIYPKEIAEKFPPAGEGHRVHRDRPLQAGRVEAGPAHPDGPLRRLQAPQREAERLRRREDRLHRPDRLDAGARRRDARGPDGDRGAAAGRRPHRRLLRPAQEQRQRAADRRRRCTTGSSRSSTRKRA